MRRQIQDGGPTPAGSSPAKRLDPFTLPIRFAAADKAADGRTREIELSRDRVVVRRAVRGMKMAVNLPVANYLGVAVRMEPPAEDTPGTVSIVLEHRDPGLSLPLFRAADGVDIVAEWQSWGRVLGVPAGRETALGAVPRVRHRSLDREGHDRAVLVRAEVGDGLARGCFAAPR